MSVYTEAIAATERIGKRIELIYATPLYVRLWCALREHAAREELCTSFMCTRCGHRKWK